MNTLLPSVILNDPASSFWLKEAVVQSLRRDPVDALDDAEVLVEVLKGRLQELQEKR